MAIPNRRPRLITKKLIFTTSVSAMPATDALAPFTDGQISFWIRADRPTQVFSSSSHYNFTQGNAYFASNDGTSPPLGANDDCAKLYQAFDVMRVKHAKLTLVATPVEEYNHDDPPAITWWSDDAAVWLTLSPKAWPHADPTAFTAAHPGYNDFDLSSDIQRARNTKGYRTQLVPGARPQSAAMTGYYTPSRIHQKDALNQSNFTMATNNDYTAAQPDPVSQAFWNVLVRPASPVVSTSGSWAFVTGVPRPHRFDIKIEYTCEFWARDRSTVSARAFQNVERE